MTPKEKAKELAIKFTSSTDVVKPNLRSKKMALLCVNEILDLGTVANEPSSSRIYNYYSKVKIELTNSNLL